MEVLDHGVPFYKTEQIISSLQTQIEITLTDEDAKHSTLSW